MFKLWCEWGVSESSLETALLFVLGTDVLVMIGESIITQLYWWGVVCQLEWIIFFYSILIQNLGYKEMYLLGRWEGRMAKIK